MTNRTLSVPGADKPLPSGVWRATEQADLPTNICHSHHQPLDQWLPGGGWPIGSLIEILTDAPGSGELALVAPGLAALPTQRPIVLINPPGIPNALAWQQWQIASQRLWWLHAKSLPDAWWSAQTVLHSQSFAALLAWVDPIDDSALRRLHARIQDTRTLTFLFRPQSATRLFSPSPLRLRLTSQSPGCIEIDFLKSKGRKPAQSIALQIAQPAISPLHRESAYVDGHQPLTMAR